MMNLINSVPDYIGWISVGVVGCLCAVMIEKVVRDLVLMIAMMREDEYEDL